MPNIGKMEGDKMTKGSDFRASIDPGEGKKIPGTIFKVSKEDTRGTLSIWEHPYPPGVLVPPHAHASHDQVMFVIEGVVGARIGDDEFTAGPGAYLNKPRGVPHTIWNAGPDPARVMEITTPGGLEAFVEGIAGILTGGESPYRRTLSEHAAKYDTTLVMDWVPELERKYKVHLMGGTGRP